MYGWLPPDDYINPPETEKWRRIETAWLEKNPMPQPRPGEGKNFITSPRMRDWTRKHKELQAWADEQGIITRPYARPHPMIRPGQRDYMEPKPTPPGWTQPKGPVSIPPHRRPGFIPPRQPLPRQPVEPKYPPGWTKPTRPPISFLPRPGYKEPMEPKGNIPPRPMPVKPPSRGYVEPKEPPTSGGTPKPSGPLPSPKPVTPREKFERVARATPATRATKKTPPRR